VCNLAVQLGTLLSAVISSQLTTSLSISHGHYEALWLLIVICAGASLIPLLLVPLIPTEPFHVRSSLRFDDALRGDADAAERLGAGVKG